MRGGYDISPSMIFCEAQSDTIYAPVTAKGRAGVAVVRVSGRLAGACVLALTGRTSLPEPRRATLCHLIKPDTRAPLDDALVLWLPGPKSYTGEDMAEFQVHGSRAVLQALGEALAFCGARLAMAGEFTRRAVVQGRMDLTEAEAVMDLVDAETDSQRKQALRQLGGGLKDLYAAWRLRLTQLQAHGEALIDFADDDLPTGVEARLCADIAALKAEIEVHLADARRGERLRDGVCVVILGAPNAGKSSLLNALAQRDVAIVTPIAGTTRDVLEVACDLGGTPVLLVDTAGLREATPDAIEAEGIRRGLVRAAEADLRVLLFDGTAKALDAQTLAQYQPGDVVLMNKLDACAAAVAPESELESEGLPVDPVWVSAQTGQGLEELLQILTAKAEDLAGVGAAAVPTRARHREALVACLGHLEQSLNERLTLDLRAEEMRLASSALGRITGQVGVEDLLDVIFRDFCLGK